MDELVREPEAREIKEQEKYRQSHAKVNEWNSYPIRTHRKGR